ncbi:MAG: exosortase C-terminal domain/associated protein EpsI [Gemmatimonadaceae bacterium]
MLDVKAYIPATILLVGCAFMLNMRTQSRVPLAAPLEGILGDIKGYRIEKQTIDDESRKLLGNTDYVARVYYKDTVPIFTTFVSYYDRQTQGKTIHSPRNCLPGAGWEVLTAGTAVIAVDGAQHVVNRYELKHDREMAVVYYWYQGRGRVVANEYTVKWNLLRDAAIAGHTEEALVRVMVPVNPPATTASESDIRRAVAAADSVGVDISEKVLHDVNHALPQGRLDPSKVAFVSAVTKAP